MNCFFAVVVKLNFQKVKRLGSSLVMQISDCTSDLPNPFFVRFICILEFEGHWYLKKTKATKTKNFPGYWLGKKITKQI